MTTHRMIVEFNGDTYTALGDSADAEGLNKTTVVNRAVQLYNTLRLTQERGRQVVIEDGSGVPVILRRLQEGPTEDLRT